MVGALGVGNAPLGQGAVAAYGLAPMSTIMATCNALGYNMLFWPNATNPKMDCYTPQSSGATAGGMLVPANPVAGSSRTPYVMTVTSTSATIRWRSATPTPTVVAVGTAAATLTQAVSADAGGVLEHTALLSGLTAGTTYYYAAGAALATSTTAAYSFKTSPAPGGAAGSARVRLWAHGDFGSQTKGVPAAPVLDRNVQANVYAAWLAYETSTGRTADAWLALGDNAYHTGSDPLYQYNFFNVYASLLGRTPVYPVIGNHDAYSWLYTPVAQSAYNTAFGPALAAVSGVDGPGVASGTMHYYSFNIGRVHVVALDSMTLRSNNSKFAQSPLQGTNYNSPTTYISSLSSVPGWAAAYAAAGSPNQADWLAADLAAVAQAGQTDWILCQYHHPSHSDGSHKSDIEIEMVEMRVVYNPILEAGGVDVCFHGHSHGYERMIPTAGFYGNQSTYAASYASPGYVPGTYAGNASATAAVFTKPAGITANGGTTYIVAGSGGQYTAPSGSNYRYVISGSLNATQLAGLSLAVDVNGYTLTVTAISGGVPPQQGVIIDQYNITKASVKPPPPSQTNSPPASAPPAAAPSPPPAGGGYVVSATVTLTGLTVSTFNTAAQTAFINTVASQLNVSASAVAITSVTAAASAGRHLLQTGIAVAFTVTAPTAAASTALASSISSTLTAGAGLTAFTAALNTNLAAAGAPTVTGVALTTPPTVTAAPAPPSSGARRTAVMAAATVLVTAASVLL
jgi:hypothetical protein